MTTTRLNGVGRYNGRHPELAQVDDVMETDDEGLHDRVTDLEKKVLEQGDELVCLRSTLADVLRRLSQYENRSDVAIRASAVNGALGGGGGGSAGRLRYQGKPGDVKDGLRRTASSHTQPASQTPAPSMGSAGSRQHGHYQSSGSLHSDSHCSSNSVSPVPPSPSPAPRTPPPPRTTASNLHTAKRWSSTGDFNHSPHGGAGGAAPSPMVPGSRLATKSLLNLYTRPHQQQHGGGTRGAVWNAEESMLRMYLRGRPVVLHAPTDVAPAYDVAKVGTPPSERLKLDWVYGYRGKDCRSNVHLLPTGELVYFVAAVVVLHNVEEHAQRHYTGHTDDVRCISVHPNKLMVATGQVAGHADLRPHIRVWNSVSLQTVRLVGLGDFDRSICCISFSKADGGAMLCAVDESGDHNISVWDWQKGDQALKITETKCSSDTVVMCEFHPLDRNAIVTCGKSHISFWTLDGNGMLYKRMGVFENRDRPKFVTSIAFTQSGDVLSGDSNGNIIVWGRGTNTVLRVARNVHDGAVFSLCPLKDGSLVSGGKDGRLIQLDASLSGDGVQTQVPLHLGGVRVVSEGRGSQLHVGTTKNCVLSGTLSMGLSPVVIGHTEEVWALAVHPTLPQFVSAGHDKLLHLWDSMSHSVIWTHELAEGGQSAAFSPDGSVLVVGCVSGRWLALDTETREPVAQHQDGGEAIQVARFSPDGNQVALGSRDNNIYIYQVSDQGRKYSRVGRCMGHSSFITHLDWSSDGQNIQSNSGDYELLYWNASTCRQIPQASQMRDIDWASNSCVLTFSTLGVWPEHADGTDVNGCDRSHDRRLLATADDFGKVKLFSYPCTQPKSLSHSGVGHSSHVTSVQFLHDDSRLISTGGRDASVMQWTLS